MENTETMIYDLDTHKYYVTSLGVKNKFNIDLKTELASDQSSGLTEEKVFIKQVSDRVYRWLYNYVRPETVKIIEYRIGTNFVPRDYAMDYRSVMEECLYAQVEYMINFDGDMKAIAESDNNLLVSIEVKDILRASGMATKSKIGYRVPQDEWRLDY